MKEQNRQIYSFDGFELDSANRQLRRGDKPLPLPAKAFDVLVALVESEGRLVSKDEIFANVWHDQIVEESNLTVYISQIRKALGETKGNQRFIETVPGYGYRFAGEIRNLEDEELVIETETLSRITIEKESEPSAVAGGLLPQTEVRSPKTKYYLAAGAFAILSIIGGIFWLAKRNQTNGAIAPAALAEKQAQIKRLTNKGMVGTAVLSPDGKFFAYSLRERESLRHSLWLGQTSGNSDVQLRPVADINYVPRSFSTDGGWLYYTASEPRRFVGTLYKIPVLGGVSQKLLTGISIYAVLSPGEKQVAFVRGSQENKTSALIVANIDGTEEREIVVRPAGQSFNRISLSWSADGAFIAFGAANGAGKNEEIFAANVSDGSVRQITTLEWLEIARVEWRADGSGLLAVARDKNSLAATQLWQIDYESGKAQKITRDLQAYGSPLSLSKDSNTLVAVQVISESNIWIAPAENLAAARQITFGSSGTQGWFGMDWTPDGKIIYTARVDQGLTLWKTDADGTNAKQITSDGFLDKSPATTADGKYIVFQSNRSGATEIWRVDSDGADLLQLTTSGGNTLPHVTPDGKAIVYTHSSDVTNSVWRISVEGGEGKQITDAESFNARVSPDGRFIACGYVENGKTKLAIVPMTGGVPAKLFEVPPSQNFFDSIRWTRDGKSVAYRDWANGVWQQSVTGGEPKRLEGLPAEKIYTYDWSRDGKQFAFTRGRSMRDAVLITDF